MSTKYNYNKEQCLQWVKNPKKNPATGANILFGKGTFKAILDACKILLSKEEIGLANQEMLPIIFTGDTTPIIKQENKIPIKMKSPMKPSLPLPVNPDLSVSHPVRPKKEKPPSLPLPLPLPPSQQPNLIADASNYTDPVNPTDNQLIEIGTNKDVHIPKKKNVFDIPAIVNYKIQKMTETNKVKLAKKSNIKLTTHAEIVKYVNDDNFIIKLLTSEKKFLNYKQIQYNKLLKIVNTSLEDPLLKPDPSNPFSQSKTSKNKSDVYNSLVKRKKLLDENTVKINDRLQQLKVIDNVQKEIIEKKRAQLNNIISDKTNGIVTLLGKAREEIRNTLYSKIVSFAQAPELYINRFNNYTLMGGAGTGKTKLAGIIGNFFYNLGILNTSRVIVVTRADLVGKYIGDTAIQTRGYLESSFEGVLFIDEAYQLSGCPDKKGNFTSNDFGSEAITEIVNYVDKNIGLSVIIAAGYEDKMNDCFLKINEGMKRRFPNNMMLINYTSQDLSDILFYNIIKMFNKQILTQSQIEYISKIIKLINEKYKNHNLFVNQAGDMLNLSSDVVQDLILSREQGYVIKNINDTFSKYFINKGYQVLIK